MLDIGSGSGLLAMMAVRAGATRVSSLEMVLRWRPWRALRAQANGMADRIRIHEMKSTDIEADAIGGRAGMLVCELVDNEMLGEGTLFSIADARLWLLVLKARVVPRGGSLFALPIEVKTLRRAGGLHLDELRLFNTDACFREGKYSNDGRKMQLLGEDEWAALGAPLRLFDFDWESELVDSLCDPRVTTVSLTVTQSGTLNAFLVYFHLACDDEDANTMSTGPDDVPFPRGGRRRTGTVAALPAARSASKRAPAYASSRALPRHLHPARSRRREPERPPLDWAHRASALRRAALGGRGQCGGATVHLLDPLGQGPRTPSRPAHRAAAAKRWRRARYGRRSTRCSSSRAWGGRSRTIRASRSCSRSGMSAETLAASDPSGAHPRQVGVFREQPRRGCDGALRKFLAPNELAGGAGASVRGARWVLATEVLRDAARGQP